MKYFKINIPIFLLGFAGLFFSSSIFATCFQDGFAAGIASCQVCPPTTTIEKEVCITSCCSDKYDSCKSCCSTQLDTNGTITQGVQQCQNTPASCGLLRPTMVLANGSTGHQASYDAGILKGEEQCQTDSANLIKSDLTLADNSKGHKASYDAGQDECITNPETCFTEFAPTPIPEAGYCENGTKNCMPDMIFNYSNVTPSGIYLSTIYDADDTNTPLLKNIPVNILVGNSKILLSFDYNESFVIANTNQLSVAIQDSDEKSGMIMSAPIGISCDCQGDDCITNNNCIENYETDSEVKLFAISKMGYSFSGWNGDGCSENNNPITLTMKTEKTCTATFELTPSIAETAPSIVEPEFVTLTINITGDGAITVNEEDKCDGDKCTFMYKKNAEISLKPTMSSSNIANATGYCANAVGGLSPNLFPMDDDKECTVEFVPK